jgi:lysophospholipase L1-like esterase
VTAAELPLGASVVGVSVVGRVWLTPGDPPGLYVESSAGVERWLPLPTPRSLDRPASVTMIGDSILEGADPVMAELLGSDWTVSLDAVVGRDAAGAAAVAEALPDPTADAVVVEIGVNDHDAGVFAAGQDRILAAVADADLVLWVNAHGPDVAVPAINEALTAGMAAWPVGAVADWDRWVPEASLSSDGVHPDTGNAALLADLVVPLLSSWRQAVWGGGPARCVDEVTAAVVG